MPSWNNWYHCTGSTYGVWLRGDPRGWRARNHREHVDGDYKNPPARGTWDHLHEESKHSLKYQRVILTASERKFLCREVALSLLSDNVEVVELCIGAKHWHLLARFQPVGSGMLTNDRTARTLIGRAKGRSAHSMTKAGLREPGRIWSVRCRAMPVRDRSHQVNIARYIQRHSAKGAAVWSIQKKLESNAVSKPRDLSLGRCADPQG